jgi:uncharacterized protein (DUF934 family)
MELITAPAPLPEDTLHIDNGEDVLARPDSIRGRNSVALHFPKWTDGRAYSQAVLLRARLRYAGQIFATGDVVVDMLPLLRRCGFTGARLREDQRTEAAARVMGHVHTHYQRSLAERGALGA